MDVNLVLNADQQWITLTDNAGGVPFKNLRLLIAPGGSNNDVDGETIGIFGVGSKRAVVAIAEAASIKTRFGDQDSYQIDISPEWLESADWEMPTYQIPDIGESTTQIELFKLRRAFPPSEHDSVAESFGATYGLLLSEELRILVDGEKVRPSRFDKWAYPPGFEPKRSEFEVSPDLEGKVRVEITAGLILDRSAADENYGVYVYCNNRLVAKALKVREVGYFVGSEAGVPHPDASLCRAIVRINGPAKLMPWNSSKTGVNYSHRTFQLLRPTLIQLVSHFSSLSRRMKNTWDSDVFPYSSGAIQTIDPIRHDSGQRLVLPPLPRVQRGHIEQLRDKNAKLIEEMPWTLGLVEAVAAVDVLKRQRLSTGNRISLILLDSTFEIALKEFIVHRPDLFSPGIYNDAKIAEIFKNRNKVLQVVIEAMPVEAKLLERARHYYNIRNKLIHERATVGVPPEDVENYRDVIQRILNHLFGLDF